MEIYLSEKGEKIINVICPYCGKKKPPIELVFLTGIRAGFDGEYLNMKFVCEGCYKYSFLKFKIDKVEKGEE